MKETKEMETIGRSSIGALTLALPVSYALAAEQV